MRLKHRHSFTVMQLLLCLVTFLFISAQEKPAFANTLYSPESDKVQNSLSVVLPDQWSAFVAAMPEEENESHGRSLGDDVVLSVAVPRVHAGYKNVTLPHDYQQHRTQIVVHLAARAPPALSA